MLPARLQRAYGVIYTFEPMGKPIGYDPARLQRAYLPMSGMEHLKKTTPASTGAVSKINGTGKIISSREPLPEQLSQPPLRELL